MSPLEIAMAFLLGLTVLSGVAALVLPGDPLRMTRVLLAIASALVFQAHVLLEGAQPSHWPLYAAGFVVLVAVGGHWFFTQTRGAHGPSDPSD